jgi:hypothetical protein
MDLGINDRHRGGASGARLRFGLRSTQQRWPGGGQRRPNLQHGTPVDKPVSGTGLIGHFPLHRASGLALFRSNWLRVLQIDITP